MLTEAALLSSRELLNIGLSNLSVEMTLSVVSWYKNIFVIVKRSVAEK